MVIGDVLAGHDVLVRSPTGSGKTLAFGIPIVDRIASDGPRPAALILALGFGDHTAAAGRILDRHRPAAEIGHLGPEGDVPFVQGGPS